MLLIRMQDSLGGMSKQLAAQSSSIDVIANKVDALSKKIGVFVLASMMSLGSYLNFIIPIYHYQYTFFFYKNV